MILSSRKDNSAQPASSSSLQLRSQKIFLATIGIFVVVCSFGYGFVKGSRNVAQASFLSVASAKPIPQSMLPDMLKGMLPRDAQVASMGTDLTINGLEAEMISFTVERDLQFFTFEHRTLWKRKGFKSRQQTSDRRSISFAMNSKTGQRASLVVWVVPPSVRNAVSNGFALQGTLSIIEPGRERKKLPGIPTMAGSIAGAIVASTDLGKRTFTGSFSNPGIVSESMEFYHSHLEGNGWEAMRVAGDSVVKRQRVFRRGVEELTLIFAQLPEQVGISGGVGERTLISAVLSVKLSSDPSLRASSKYLPDNQAFGG